MREMELIGGQRVPQETERRRYKLSVDLEIKPLDKNGINIDGFSTDDAPNKS